MTFPWQDGGQLVDLRHCRGNAPPHGACVQSCALDAVARVSDVTVVVDALAGMDMTAGASQAALEAMARAGVRQASCDDVLSVFLLWKLPPNQGLEKLKSLLPPARKPDFWPDVLFASIVRHASKPTTEGPHV